MITRAMPRLALWLSIASFVTTSPTPAFALRAGLEGREGKIAQALGGPPATAPAGLEQGERTPPPVRKPTLAGLVAVRSQQAGRVLAALQQLRATVPDDLQAQVETVRSQYAAQAIPLSQVGVAIRSFSDQYAAQLDDAAKTLIGQILQETAAGLEDEADRKVRVAQAERAARQAQAERSGSQRAQWLQGEVQRIRQGLATLSEADRATLQPALQNLLAQAWRLAASGTPRADYVYDHDATNVPYHLDGIPLSSQIDDVYIWFRDDIFEKVLALPLRSEPGQTLKDRYINALQAPTMALIGLLGYQVLRATALSETVQASEFLETRFRSPDLGPTATLDAVHAAMDLAEQDERYPQLIEEHWLTPAASAPEAPVDIEMISVPTTVLPPEGTQPSPAEIAAVAGRQPRERFIIGRFPMYYASRTARDRLVTMIVESQVPGFGLDNISLRNDLLQLPSDLASLPPYSVVVRDADDPPLTIEGELAREQHVAVIVAPPVLTMSDMIRQALTEWLRRPIGEIQIFEPQQDGRLAVYV